MTPVYFPSAASTTSPWESRNKMRYETFLTSSEKLLCSEKPMEQEQLKNPSPPSQASCSGVAVGMRIAPHPPHGSVRADFPHTALASGRDAQAALRIRVADAGRR
jgi:hypothetical protein